jgi:hypothetical protein
MECSLLGLVILGLWAAYGYWATGCDMRRTERNQQVDAWLRGIQARDQWPPHDDAY